MFLCFVHLPLTNIHLLMSTYQTPPTMLSIEANICIRKSAPEVFEAIVDPAVMKNYFISTGSGRMEEGVNLKWSWPEFEGAYDIRVGRVVIDELITFYWKGGEKETQVQLELSACGTGTRVRALEGEMEMNEAGIKWLKGNTEGWANFLACLKAWLEYGVRLREGAFDFMKK